MFIACKEIDLVGEFFWLTVNFLVSYFFQYLSFLVEKKPCLLDNLF